MGIRKGKGKEKEGQKLKKKINRGFEKGKGNRNGI